MHRWGNSPGGKAGWGIRAQPLSSAVLPTAMRRDEFSAVGEAAREVIGMAILIPRDWDLRTDGFGLLDCVPVISSSLRYSRWNIRAVSLRELNYDRRIWQDGQAAVLAIRLKRKKSSPAGNALSIGFGYSASTLSFSYEALPAQLVNGQEVTFNSRFLNRGLPYTSTQVPIIPRACPSPKSDPSHCSPPRPRR